MESGQKIQYKHWIEEQFDSLDLGINGVLEKKSWQNMNEDKEAKKAKEAAAMADNVNILMLQETIMNLEESKVRLLLTIKELKEKLDQQKADQADIYYYLNKKCDESFEIIASLEEQLSNEQSDREIAEKMYEGRIDELKTILHSTEVKMSAKVIDLEGKVEMLNQFAHAKEETDRKLAELTHTLDREREDHRQTMEILENKFLIEREKMRASYDAKYEQLKKDLEQSIDGKLTKKTQRTQIMNVVMKKELEAQSRHADRLLEINDEIVERDKKLKMELDLARSLKDELLRKCNIYSRTNKELEKGKADALEEYEKLKKVWEEQVKSSSDEAEELRQALIKERTRNNQKVGKMDELWFFLSKAYQILGVNHNRGSGEEQSADYYSNILLDLFTHLGMKFPDFMTRFLQDHPAAVATAASSAGVPLTLLPPPVASTVMGTNTLPVTGVSSSSSVHSSTSHQFRHHRHNNHRDNRDNNSEVGIFSWRTEKFVDPRPTRLQVQMRTQGVQTDYLFAMEGAASAFFPNSALNSEMASLWKPFQPIVNSQDDNQSSAGNSLGGVFSLPTVLGATNNNNNNPSNTGKLKRPNNIINSNSSHPLNTSSMISAMTQEEPSLFLNNNSHNLGNLNQNSLSKEEEDHDTAHSVTSKNRPNPSSTQPQPGSNPVGYNFDPNHSFHTVAVPGSQKKPLNRSSVHQAKTRKLKFPEHQQAFTITNGFSSGSGNPQQVQIGSLVISDSEWIPESNYNSNHSGNNLGTYQLDRSSKAIYSQIHQPQQHQGMSDLSVSGKRFHDSATQGSLPKLA